MNGISPKDPSLRGLGTFARDPYYFLRYYLNSLILFVGLDYGLWLSEWTQQDKFSFTPYSWLLVIAGCYAGGLSAIAIHNAVHQSFRPKWLNRIMGEIAGTHQLYGYRGWRTAHILHHIYPDNPEKDPHTPINKSYPAYAFGMVKQLSNMLTINYFMVWGNGSEYKTLWKVNSVCGSAGVIARLVFWYFLLGKTGFLLFYIPSYLFNNFIFTHLNYFTHRPVDSDSNKFEILNLNHNLYYKIANMLFFGFYFHKNHHLKPSLPNPMKL